MSKNVLSLPDKTIRRSSNRSRSDISRAAANHRWQLRRMIALDAATLIDNYTQEILDAYDDEETYSDKDRKKLADHVYDLVNELKKRGQR